MEVARIRLCIAVVEVGRGPSGRRIGFGLHSRLKWIGLHVTDENRRLCRV